jgi:hypothetical protein
MKPKYTFLLSLTFLFLFSGSVYGGVIDETIDGVFDRKGEVIGLYCPMEDIYFGINLKDKNIKLYKINKRELLTTIKIIKETELYIMGKVENKVVSYFFDRHDYRNDNTIMIEVHWEKGDKTNKQHYRCSIGDKKF